MRYQKSQSYQKYFTESSKKYMTALEDFFSDRKVVKAIKKEFPYKKATPIDALRVACCQMMIEVAKADGNFSIEEEIIIEEITRYNVDPEKVKDFAGGYLLNGNGVPLIMGYACFIEEHLRQTKNEEITVVDDLMTLFDDIISATKGSDGKNDNIEAFARIKIMKNIKAFVDDYRVSKQAGYLVWAYNIK